MKKYYYLLGGLQAFTALGAIPAGIGYLIDISGKAMGVTPEFLSNSPLKTFLLPGLFLLFINGISNLIAAYFSFTRNRLAGISGLLLGIALTLWIIIQVIWISLTSFLQPLFFVIGLVNTYLGWRIMRSNLEKN